MAHPINSLAIVYLAKWVLPVGAPPIENGIVAVDQGKIVAVQSRRSFAANADQIVDLGDGAIIPGLVNAHTHLEFSSLDRPLGQPGMPFTDWIRLVVEYRNEPMSTSARPSAIARGLRESLRHGVSALGDIATSPVHCESYTDADVQMGVTLFHEQLGRDLRQLENKDREMARFFSSSSRVSSELRVELGASPHAPYSVHPELLRQICKSARSNRCAVAMHVAETREEIELLEDQTGPFVDLLKDLGVWSPDSFKPVQTIGEVLDCLAKAPRSLVIHGNYLLAQQLDQIAVHRDRMSIVFCPRTHAFFCHDDYPLPAMLQRGIRVALGTDSRASNPDLSLFEEMKQVARRFPDIAFERILEMGTSAGAAALGMDDEFGSIAVGKRAVLSFVLQPSGEQGRASSFDWMFQDTSECRPV